jgi:hypothetical protein
VTFSIAAALDAAFAQHRPRAVIHFAALAYVGESMSQPLAYYRVNVAGLVSVVEAIAIHPRGRDFSVVPGFGWQQAKSVAASAAEIANFGPMRAASRRSMHGTGPE